jgi:hypothetical protein
MIHKLLTRLFQRRRPRPPFICPWCERGLGGDHTDCIRAYVANKAFVTGKPVFVTIDDDGNLIEHETEEVKP